MVKCPRCAGFVYRGLDGARSCLNCGWTEPVAVPADIDMPSDTGKIRRRPRRQLPVDRLVVIDSWRPLEEQER